MSERLHIGDSLKNPRLAVVPAVLAALALTGCDISKSGYSFVANGRSIEPCESQSNYQQQSGNTAVTSRTAILATAESDVVTLQKRALNDSGTIGLDNYPGTNTVEINASPTSLTLSFPGRHSSWWERYNHDQVTFTTKEGASPVLSPGAVICSAGGDLYPNGIYATLQRDVQETADLGQ